MNIHVGLKSWFGIVEPRFTGRVVDELYQHNAVAPTVAPLSVSETPIDELRP